MRFRNFFHRCRSARARSNHRSRTTSKRERLRFCESLEPRAMLANVSTVDGTFSVLLDNAPGNVNASDGNLMLHQSGLVYSSRTVADAVVEVRATLPSVNGNRPTHVNAYFTFPGQMSQNYYWNV